MPYDSVEMVVSIRDGKNQETTKRFELMAIDAGVAETDAAAMLALFQPLCDGEILSYTVSGKVNVSDSVTGTSLKSDVMSITAQLHGRPEKANLRLPCFPDSKSDANGVLDLTDADVVAFQNAFIGLSTNIARLSDGETIENFLRGKLKS